MRGRDTGRRSSVRRSARRARRRRGRPTGSPAATTLPSRSTVTRSASSSTSSSMWLTNSTPAPCSATRRTSRNRASTSPRLSDAVGSSSTSSPGRVGVPVLQGAHDRHGGALGGRQRGDGLAHVGGQPEARAAVPGLGRPRRASGCVRRHRCGSRARGRGSRPSTASAPARGPGGRCGCGRRVVPASVHRSTGSPPKRTSLPWSALT